MRTVDKLPVSRKALSKLALCLIAMTFCACALLMADRNAHEEHRQQMVKTMDNAHVFVTTEGLPKSKPYVVLGELKYSEPYTPDALDHDRIENKLKAMALAQYPDQVDAVIDTRGDIETSGDTTTVTVSGQAVKFESSADRELMHHMWENTVVSPK